MIARAGLAVIGKTAALLLLFAALGLAALVVGSPLLAAREAREASLMRLDRFKAALTAAKPAESHFDPNEFTAERADEGEAQLALQSDLDRLAKKAGLVAQSLRPLPAEAVGEIGRTVWIDATLSGDLQALTDFMIAADAKRPVLLMRRLDIGRGPDPRPDSFLSIHAEIGAAWRPTANSSEAGK